VTANNLLKKYAALAPQKAQDLNYLLLEITELSGSDFYANFDLPLDSKVEARFIECFELFVQKHLPIQQILGYAYFYGYKLKVNQNCLIPRKETEELVGLVLEEYDQVYATRSQVEVLDLGCGSGAIAIALKLEEPRLMVEASDISPEALAIAKENAQNLNADINFVLSNWFSNITKAYDIIVCNPPYIPNAEKLDPIVAHDPALALFGGTKGLDCYEIVLKSVSKHLKNGGLLAFEHAYNQKDNLIKLIQQYLTNIEINSYQDFQGRDRMILVRLKEVENE
jgi:release factor glutamine methyltransferase